MTNGPNQSYGQNEQVGRPGEEQLGQSSPKIRVLIVDDMQDTCDNLSRILGFERDIEVVGYALGGESALARCRQLWPDVLLLDVNLGPGAMDGFALTKAIHDEMPWMGVVLMSVQGEDAYLRRAMQAGAGDFLRKPSDFATMATSIRNVYAMQESERVVAAQAARAAASSGGAKSPLAHGLVIAVVSPRGGMGKTTVSTNLAIALKQVTGQRVVLVDADVVFGNVRLHLNMIKSGRSVLDSVVGIEHLDDELLESCVTPHRSGVNVLLAPSFPLQGETINPEHLPVILARLSQLYDFVVVDTGPQFVESVVSVLEVADLILVVTALDIAAIWGAKLYIDAAEKAGLTQRTDVVINHWGQEGRDGMRPQSIEQELGANVSYRLAHAGDAAFREVNKGVPMVEGHKDEPFVRDINAMAAAIAEQILEARRGDLEPQGTLPFRGAQAPLSIVEEATQPPSENKGGNFLDRLKRLGRVSATSGG